MRSMRASFDVHKMVNGRNDVAQNKIEVKSKSCLVNLFDLRFETFFLQYNKRCWLILSTCLFIDQQRTLTNRGKELI